MTKNLRKLGVFSVITFMFLSLAACSQANKASNSSDQKKTTQEEPNVNRDTKKTKQLKKEKEVFDGKVYVQDNVATATMIIKDGVSEADAKVLAEKYAKQLKEQYKDMKVNVQAVQSGKNIANVTLEK